MLVNVNPEIVAYVESEIIPRYHHFDSAHTEAHVRAVIADSLSIAEECGADLEMSYVIAAYHDTGMVEGRETHHLASGRILAADEHLKRWFSDEQLAVMRQAVEDHRASGKNVPRSIYGKIVADADREIANLQPFRRTIQYGLIRYPELDKEGSYLRFCEHIIDKYARGGYLHLWIPGSGKEQELKALQDIIEDENELRKTFDILWDELTK